MAIRRAMAKFGNMRKMEDFIVYPRPTNVGPEYNTLTIQSSHRIAKFDATTGVGLLSAYRSGGAYFHDLLFNTMPITVPADLLKQFNDAQPKSGDVIGKAGGVCVLVA
jgi:hypothetical protein